MMPGVCAPVLFKCSQCLPWKQVAHHLDARSAHQAAVSPTQPGTLGSRLAEASVMPSCRGSWGARYGPGSLVCWQQRRSTTGRRWTSSSSNMRGFLKGSKCLSTRPQHHSRATPTWASSSRLRTCNSTSCSSCRSVTRQACNHAS